MSWGYGGDTDIVADAATHDNGERATMFSNDGLSSNNIMVKGLLEKGYAMKDVQDAIENVQAAIQRGMAPSEMPRGVLPHVEVIELYDEAAMQAGRPSSDEMEAQKQMSGMLLWMRLVRIYAAVVTWSARRLVVRWAEE